MKARLFVLTMTLLLAGWTLHGVAVAEPAVSHPLQSLPFTLGAWTGQAEAPLDADTLAVLRVDDYVMRTYRHGPEAVELYVGYYASQRQGGTMHSPLNCLPGAGWESVSKRPEQVVAQDGATIDLNRYIVQKGLDERMVLYWYQSHGRSVASEYWSRAYLVMDSLRIHRSDGALVRVVTGPIEDEARAETAATGFVGAIAPALLHTIPR
jgi:EpsI family protein